MKLTFYGANASYMSKAQDKLDFSCHDPLKEDKQDCLFNSVGILCVAFTY